MEKVGELTGVVFQVQLEYVKVEGDDGGDFGFQSGLGRVKSRVG